MPKAKPATAMKPSPEEDHPELCKLHPRRKGVVLHVDVFDAEDKVEVILEEDTVPMSSSKMLQSLMEPFIDFKVERDRQEWLKAIGLFEFATLSWGQWKANIYAKTQMELLRKSKGTVSKKSALKKLVDVSIQTLGAEDKTQKPSVLEGAVEDSSQKNLREVAIAEADDAPTVREKVENGADTYEDMIYLAKVKSRKIKRKMELGMVNLLEYVPVAMMAECSLVQTKVCDVHVRRLDELINKEELHIEVNQEAEMVIDVRVPIQLEEIKPVLVKSLYERAAECNQVADTRDLEANEESEQSHKNGKAFVEQKANGGVDAELVYGADDDEDTSLSCLETSKEDRPDESTSYGEETEPDGLELVKVKLPYYVFDDMIVANVQEEQRQSKPRCMAKAKWKGQGLQVQSFAKKNRVAVPMDEDKDGAIENKFLSSLVKYDAEEEQMFEEQLEEIKPVLVESLYERAAECNQVADTRDLEADEESEQSHKNGQAFVEQKANGGVDAELVYGADDDEDTSLSCSETSEEDRADESTSYGKEIEPDGPELVKVKLPYYVFDDMIVANVQEEQRIEQARVHDKGQVERSRPTGDDKQVKLVCGAMVVAMLMKVAVEYAIVVQ
ncbi:hypothetical protein L7F22_031290 [Adiantum nelumboides]|nr:hypothetical protein [Adiantum nelumboides]